MENETIFCLTLSALLDVRKGLLSMSAVANYFSSFDTLATNTVDENVKTVMLAADNIDEIREVKKLLDDNGINQISIGDRTLGIEDACVCFVVDDCVTDRDDYPDFAVWALKIDGSLPLDELYNYQTSDDEWVNRLHNEWIKAVMHGDEKRALLREIISQFKEVK